MMIRWSPLGLLLLQQLLALLSPPLVDRVSWVVDLERVFILHGSILHFPALFVEMQHMSQPEAHGGEKTPSQLHFISVLSYSFIYPFSFIPSLHISSFHLFTFFTSNTFHHSLILYTSHPSFLYSFLHFFFLSLHMPFLLLIVPFFITSLSFLLLPWLPSIPHDFPFFVLFIFQIFPKSSGLFIKPSWIWQTENMLEDHRSGKVVSAEQRLSLRNRSGADLQNESFWSPSAFTTRYGKNDGDK